MGHVLVAYIMKPKAGYDYLATAAHFAAESSTGTNVNVCTTDDFTKSVDALVYYIDPDEEEMKIAYPTMLFDRNITDGRAMMCSILTLSIGNNQGMGDVEYGKIYDIYFPPPYLRLFDGPAVNILDMWRLFGRPMVDGGLVVGTIIKPKLGLQPKPFGEACYGFWQGGDFIKNDEPQGNQVFCQMNECIPEVVKAMRACIKETGESKLFSANITADDPNEMIARGKYILGQFGQYAENCAFLVDGYVAGGTAVTVCRRNFPRQFLHYHRAGHGSVTSPQTQRGYTAFVHTKISRVIGSSGIHVGTMSFGKMEGDASDKNIAFMLQDDVIEYAKTHEEIKGAFLTFQKDADQIYPGWKEKLGYTGESSVQAASFDWQKKAAAAAYAGAPPWNYAKPERAYCELVFGNDVGYLPDGTPMHTAGNMNNHEGMAGADPHVAGSPLPKAAFVNDVGYLPDGTPMNTAGNMNNHEGMAGADPHTPGSPLPPPLKGYVNDIGYLPDGTDLAIAGNLSNHR